MLLQQFPPLSLLLINNKLVIYGLPTSWSTANNGGRDVGTFNDVLALLVDN